MILALTLMLSAGLAVPVMAGDDTQSGKQPDAAEILQPEGSGQSQQSDEEKTQQPAEIKTKTGKTKALTPAQKEAQEIKEYGKYKGKNAKKIPVITYHNVVTDRQKRSERYRYDSIVISKSDFENQMRWLKKNGYRTISCEELYLWHKGRIKLPKKSVLITLDDGRFGVPKNAYPILKKYDLKATCFVIGSYTMNNKPEYMKYREMKKIQNDYPNLEFQSHTWKLHYRFSLDKGVYSKVLKDAKKQKAKYGFEYLAYPYGRNNDQMIKAYKKAGIKMAFAYRQYGDGYATRDQNIYRIKRIKVQGNGSMYQFRSIFRY